MAIYKAIQIQKKRSQQKKKLEMKQFIQRALARKKQANIEANLPEDILGLGLSTKKINRIEYDICRSYENIYNSVWNPNIKASNFNENPKGEMQEETLALLKSKLDLMDRLLGGNRHKVVNVIVYGQPPKFGWEKFKKYISPLARL